MFSDLIVFISSRTCRQDLLLSVITGRDGASGGAVHAASHHAMTILLRPLPFASLDRFGFPSDVVLFFRTGFQQIQHLIVMGPVQSVLCNIKLHYCLKAARRSFSQHFAMNPSAFPASFAQCFLILSFSCSDSGFHPPHTSGFLSQPLSS